MKYLVITTKGRFDFALGELVAKKGQLVCRDANGAAHIEQGSEIVAIMRSDFVDDYESSMAELERLRSQNGRNGH